MVPVGLGQQQEGTFLVAVGLHQGHGLRLNRLTQFPALAVVALTGPGQL